MAIPLPNSLLQVKAKTSSDIISYDSDEEVQKGPKRPPPPPLPSFYPALESNIHIIIIGKCKPISKIKGGFFSEASSCACHVTCVQGFQALQDFGSIHKSMPIMLS